MVVLVLVLSKYYYFESFMGNSNKKIQHNTIPQSHFWDLLGDVTVTHHKNKT